MEFRLVAYDRLGARRGVLPVPLEFTPVHSMNELPTLTIHYPRFAVNSTYLDNDPEVAFEYCVDGKTWIEPRDSRFRLQKVDLDYLDKTATTRYDFIGIGEFTRGIYVYDSYGLPLNDEGKVQFKVNNPGQIINTVWYNAQNSRGWTGYTKNHGSTTDSKGTAWGTTFTQSYAKEASLDTIISTLVAQGQVDHWMEGRQHNMVVAGSTQAFTDHVTDGVRFFGSGNNSGVDSAPEQIMHGGLATHVVVIGENNQRWVFPTAVTLPEGRREVFLTYSGVDDAGTAQLLAWPAVTRAQYALKNTTRQFHLTPETKNLPYHNYKVGDWLVVQRGTKQDIYTPMTSERMRIQSISITINKHGAQGYVTLGDKIDQYLDILNKKIQAMTGGVKNSGSTAPPPKSARKPRPATGLVVGNEPYIDESGNTKTVVNASWTHDGKDVNGDVLDIKEYWFFWRYPGTLNWTLLTKTSENTLTYSPVDTYGPNGNPATYEFTIETHAENGTWSAIADPVTSTMVTDNTPPPVPKAPTPSTWLKTVSVAWDGLAVGNVGMPTDFTHVNVWQSTSADGSGAVKVGQLVKSASLSLGTRTAGTTYWYALSAVDRSGNESAKSTWASVTPQSIIDNSEIDAIVDEIQVDIGANRDDIIAAQQDADDALLATQQNAQDIIAAAALAAGKSDVKYQPNPPEPSSNTLWIDTDNGNLPMVWTGVLGALPRVNLNDNAEFANSSGSVTVRTNRVLDPSFESGVSDVIKSNTLTLTQTTFTKAITDKQYACQITVGPNTTPYTYMYKSITAAEGEYIAFALSVRRSIGSPYFRIRIGFHDAANAQLGLYADSVRQGVNNDTGGQRYSFVTPVAAPTGTVTARVYLYLYDDAAGTIGPVDTTSWATDSWHADGAADAASALWRVQGYFDGGSAATDDLFYEWSGAAYTTPSLERGRGVAYSVPAPGTGGAQVVYQSKDAPPGAKFSMKAVQTQSGTGGSAGFYIYPPEVGGKLGDVLSAKLLFKSNVKQKIRLLVRPREGSTIMGADPVEYTIVEPNVWSEVKLENRLATGDYSNVLVWPWIQSDASAGTTSTMAVGDTLQMALLVVEKSPTVGPFFSGDYLGCSWAGTKDNSNSIYAGPQWVPSQDQAIIAAQAKADSAMTAAQNAQLAANAAALAANAAQSTADGKTTVSAAVPNNTTDLAGKPAGALWTQVVAGKVVGAWYKPAADSTAWVSMPFDPVMIPVINIGTGTFGDLDGIRMKLNSLGVDKLLVSDQNSYIENGTFETGTLAGWEQSGYTCTNITPYRGTYCAFSQGPGDYLINNYPVSLTGVAGNETEHRVKLYAKGGTGAKINLSIINPVTQAAMTDTKSITLTTTWTEYSVNLKAFAGGWGKLKIISDAANLSTQSVYLDEVRMYRRENGELIIDGSILAAMIKSREIKADHLEAGLILTSEIIAGNPAGTHAKMSPDGFRVFAADPVNPANPPREVVRMGVGGTNNDYLGIVKPDGQLGASIDENGTVSTDKLFVGDGGMYYKGRELRVLMDEASLGLVAWGQFNGNQMPGSSATNGPIPNGVELGLFELAWTPVGTRMYAVSCSPVLFTPYNGVATAACFRIRYTTDGSQPTTSSPILAEDYKPILANGAWTMSFQMADRMVGGFNGSYIRVLFTIAASNGQGLWTELGQSPTFMVKDLGPAYPKNGVLSTQISTGGGGSQAVKTTRVETFVSTSSQSYDGSLAKYNFDGSHMYQGLSPAGYGNLRSLAFFNPGNQWWDGRLSGATINFMRLYFYFPHWYYNSGGTAYVGVHNGFSGTVPNTWSHSTGIMFQPNWPKPGGYWLDIPSTYWANIANGTYRGFSLYGDNTYQTYGYADRPKLQIGYTK